MRRLKTFFILGALAITANWAQATMELPALIGDHMVFQAGKPAVVWGKDQPGQKITISMNGQSASTQADKKGRWKTSLPAFTPGGPYPLVIEGSSSVTISDVLVGEVWLGSGQSNMEFRLDQSKDGDKAIAESADPQMRLFLQKPIMSPKPLEEPQGEWKVCGPGTAGPFSAVAYYFGKTLRESLKVPVGLIAASWGGSYAESWTPEQELRADPALKPVWKRWDALSASDRNQWQKGRFGVDLSVRNLKFVSKDPNQKPLSLQAKDVSLTAGVTLKPGTWGFSVKDGSSLSVKLSPEGPRMTGSFLTDAWGFMTTSLAFQGKAGDLSAYDAIEFDGKGDGKYILFLSQPTVTDWDNYRTPESFPVSKAWKHYRIAFSDLKQSGWGKAQPFTADALTHLSFGVDPKPLIEIPCALYNGMIHPYTPFPIQGVIWYQGEANTVHVGEYRDLLNSMVEGWRRAWGREDMPFILAQLPNYNPTSWQGPGEWSELREQQRLMAGEPHNGMAVLLDLGDKTDIHPKNKKEVGFRLAQCALADTYHIPGAQLSPVYDHAQLEDGRVLVFFRNAGEDLQSQGGELKGFELAGLDGKFMPAQGKIEKNYVEVWSKSVSDPRAVRYAWGDDPAFNLYGKNGLPASPFKEENLISIGGHSSR